MRKLTYLLIAFGIALCFALGHLVIELGWFERGVLSKNGLLRVLDRKALDLKFSGRDTEELPLPQVVIAAIDEKSIEQFGLWPWDRSVIADFVHATSAKDPRVIAFDAVFGDLVRNPAQEELRRIYEALDQHSERLSKTAFDAIAKDLSKIRVGPKERGTIDEARQHLAELGNDITAILENLRRDHGRLSPNQQLANALEASPETLLGYFLFFRHSEIAGLGDGDIDSNLKTVEPSAISKVFERYQADIGGELVWLESPLDDIAVTALQIPSMAAVRAPLPEFVGDSTTMGYFNSNPDPDGPIRRLRLLYKHQNQLYPALSLATAAKFHGSDIRPIEGQYVPNTLAGVSFGGHDFAPTDNFGNLLINYYDAPERYFPTYSVADFISGNVPQSAIKDKVVLFGGTAVGLYDLRPNPFSPTTPGVYIHAMAIQNMLDGNFLERFYGVALLEALVYLILGLILGLVLPRVSALGGMTITLAITALLHLLDNGLVFPGGYWTLNIYPTAMAFTIFVGSAVYGYLTEGREKRRIRDAFQFYLNKSVVDEVLQAPEKLRLGGEKRVCSVLFSDIRDFTSISEQLAPEELVNLLNEYLTPMTNLVFEHAGTLDKYIGDAIMAFYGAPVHYGDHALRACQTALRMVDELDGLHGGWRERGLPELKIGIGVHTGSMAVGNMGSEIRFDYTVMGDNVNLGSRLEGLNKQYGTRIIVSEDTFLAANHVDDSTQTEQMSKVHGRRLDAVRVKGRQDPVTIYELLGAGPPDELTARFIDHFEAGLACYRDQQWDAAVKQFDMVRLDLRHGDPVAELYIERCRQMQQTPPAPGWDGVFSFSTK